MNYTNRMQMRNRAFVAYKGSLVFIAAFFLFMLNFQQACTNRAGVPSIDAYIDLSFPLVYPELSRAIAHQFPTHMQSTQEEVKAALADIPSVPSHASPHMLLLSPALVPLESLPETAHWPIITLLLHSDVYSSIEWDSEWAYQQIGFLAGAQIAQLRQENNPTAMAAILFLRE